MADRVPDSTASIRRGLNQHGCERIVLPSHIRVQSTKLTDISFVAYTDGLCPLCMVYQMAKEFATRRYQLTINNPKEHGYDHDTIKAILAKGAKLLYWCMPGKFSLSNPPFLMFLLSLSFLRPHFRFPNLCSRYPFGIRGCGLFRD